MSTLRLAIVTPEYPGMRRPAYGGIASQYGAIAPALAAVGCEVHVLIPGAESTRREVDGVTLHGLSVPPAGPLFPLARSLAARKGLKRLPRIDAVIVADWSGNGVFLRMGETPIITHLHTGLAVLIEIGGMVKDWSKLDRRTRLQLRIERHQGEQSDAILGCSQAIVDLTRTFWDIEDVPTSVLPNVVVPDRIRELARGPIEPQIIPAGSPVIAIPGRVEMRKGGDVLIRAMHEVWEEHPEAEVIFSGSLGRIDRLPARERLLDLAARYRSQIHFTGPLPQASLFPLLARADVVVTPSRWEAFGIVTLESMALGKRIVATSGSGFSEFCHDGVNSVLAPPGDNGRLATAILTALKPGSAHLEQAARGTADRFSADSLASAYRDVILNPTSKETDYQPAQHSRTPQ